ncbi:LysR family transcriptional regulator [Hydrogenophaga sp. 5NK40-0174]|uniref:LysR family transcriptional regulator n=1 Tax=Hydrogenophaga sp. 5NK40-0174 TaxID=3127649 RepID=UPI00310BFA2C
MNLSNLDLKQLVLFNQLMTLGSVSRVAEQMDMTQPSVSNALARLRRQFGDELFVRTSGGMAPTPLAEQMAEPVAEALAMLDRAVNPSSAFDPATLERTITLGMTDIGEIVFLPRLVERLRQEAPGVHLQTVRNHTAVHLREDMESGQVDMAIGLLPQLKSGFFQRRLFNQRYVCLFRRDHPVLGPCAEASYSARITLAQFKAAEHLVITSAGTGHGQVDELLQRSGIHRTTRLTVPHFVSVGHLLQSTDLIATVPERLAMQLCNPFGLAWAKHPVKTLPQAPINVFWHARMHRAPVNQWLRGVVFEELGEG